MVEVERGKKRRKRLKKKKKKGRRRPPQLLSFSFSLPLSSCRPSRSHAHDVDDRDGSSVRSIGGTGVGPVVPPQHRRPPLALVARRPGSIVGGVKVLDDAKVNREGEAEDPRPGPQECSAVEVERFLDVLAARAPPLDVRVVLDGEVSGEPPLLLLVCGDEERRRRR